jgi:hypothetical protein
MFQQENLIVPPAEKQTKKELIKFRLLVCLKTIQRAMNQHTLLSPLYRTKLTS